jgi:hypothetical protein
MAVATSSQHARHKLATSLTTCTLCRGEGGGATWEKVFAIRCLDVDRNMLATNSQHSLYKLATCTLCRGRREGAQHGKSVRNLGKGVRNMEKVFATWEKVFTTWKKCLQHASQHHDLTLICFLIRIVWLGRCPMLVPGSDVRTLTVPYPNFCISGVTYHTKSC